MEQLCNFRIQQYLRFFETLHDYYDDLKYNVNRNQQVASIIESTHKFDIVLNTIGALLLKRGVQIK
jgi:hypothetical protein